MTRIVNSCSKARRRKSAVAPTTRCSEAVTRDQDPRAALHTASASRSGRNSARVATEVEWLLCRAVRRGSRRHRRARRALPSVVPRIRNQSLSFVPVSAHRAERDETSIGNSRATAEAHVPYVDEPSLAFHRGQQRLKDIRKHMSIHGNGSKIAIGRVNMLVPHENLHD